MGAYDEGPHIDWWQGLPGTERFVLLKKNGFQDSKKPWKYKELTNKGIYTIWSKERKVTAADLPIKKGTVEVDCIEVDGKTINLTPVPHFSIDKYITHRNCEKCGVEFKKPYDYVKKCDACISSAVREKWEKLPIVGYDGKKPLFLYNSDNQYFFDIGDIIDYCEENEIDVSELMLVTCVKSSFSEIDIEDLTSSYEVVHEDWEPSDAFLAKLAEFNEWLTRQNTNTYFPSNERVVIRKEDFDNESGV
ncbi:hypothetical protein [Sphingobacterium sp. LRF_L2]|uniref:hypothetical protein n=1 Tax=Sphingobacterium sp. LRF_L2 TaxID=3369421 RepID=UPI003F620720